MSPSIFIFVALSCEARPLINRWKLRRLISSDALTIYAGDRYVLVITGMGNVAMAGAIGYTFGLFPGVRFPVIVNIGIAGHREKSLGSLGLANKITNDATGKTFYPQLPFNVSCETAEVITVAKARSDYADLVLYDMEAAGFFEMACRFSSIEVIHSIKIVSDNCFSPVVNIHEKLVTNWIERQMSVISGLISEIEKSRNSLPSSDDVLYEQILAKYHFTVSNALKLKNLLRYRRLMDADSAINPLNVEARHAKDLTDWLEREIREKPFYL